MAKIFAGTKEDKRILQEVIDEHNRRKVVKEQPVKEQHKDQSSQIFVIQPDEEIPARSGDTVTSKDCKIFQLKEFDYSAGTAKLTPQETVKRGVYNLGTDAIPTTGYDFCVNTNYKDLVAKLGGTGTGGGEKNEATYVGQNGETYTRDRYNFDGIMDISTNIESNATVGFENRDGKLFFSKTGFYLLSFLFEVDLIPQLSSNTFGFSYQMSVEKYRNLATLPNEDLVSLGFVWDARETIDDNLGKFEVVARNKDPRATPLDHIYQSNTGTPIVEIKDTDEAIGFGFESIVETDEDFSGSVFVRLLHLGIVFIKSL